MDDPTAAAAAISAARDRLLAFVDRCPEERWGDAPLGDGDPRAVAVVVDHVADSYVYLGGWIRAALDGDDVRVTSDLVDELNAEHAGGAAGVDRDDVRAHLREHGDRLAALVAGVDQDRWASGDGMIGRLAEIAARHADAHRADLEAALGLGRER